MADNGSVDLQPKEIGGHKVLQVIGTGGLGTVYKVNTEDGLRALKLMHAVLTINHGPELFEQEAKLLKKISSPHVVRYFGEGVHEGRPYLLIEWVSSELSLHQLLKNGALAAKEAANIAQGIAKALHDVHGTKIIHRDLKPANIMLIRVVDGWNVKLIDFNVAELIEKSCETKMAMGSPYYMSPEQARGETLDEKTDVFALGCILFEMLTGNTLVNEKDNALITAAHANMRHAPLGARPDNVPPRVWEVLQKMLKHQPEERPSAQEVENELRALNTQAEAPLPLQLPLLPEPGPPRTIHRGDDEEITTPTQAPQRSLTAWVFGGMMGALLLFVGGSTLYAKILERWREQTVISDVPSLDVTVRPPSPPQDPTPAPRVEPESPAPRPAPVRRMRRTASATPPPRTTVAIPRPAPIRIRGAELLDSGNYRIPHPDDWDHVSPGRRRTMCAAFHNRGVQGQLFHQFCNGFLPEE